MNAGLKTRGYAWTSPRPFRLRAKRYGETTQWR